MKKWGNMGDAFWVSVIIYISDEKIEKSILICDTRQSHPPNILKNENELIYTIKNRYLFLETTKRCKNKILVFSIFSK